LEMPPGGVDNITRAWYGDPRFKWREGDGYGEVCTDRVKELLGKDGRLIVSREALRIDPVPRARKQLLVEVHSNDIRTLHCNEGAELLIPAGAASIVKAWLGDKNRPWQEKENVGRTCTDEVRRLTNTKGRILVSSDVLGFDPAPGFPKRLLVHVRQSAAETDLFIAGQVLEIYRCNGALQAALVPNDLPSLRRIFFDKRLFSDHFGSAYHRALLNVRARMRAPQSVKWQGFAEAGRVCPRCYSDYAWMKSAQSDKQRIAAMTNCRACGLVVCTDCSTGRRAFPEQGILEPARICDRCAFLPPDGASAMWNLPRILAET